MSQIIDVNALQQYKDDYKLYAIYVARERMMADVRDGLKPVARKIMISSKDLNVINKTVKSARIVGETMGKYHPHGDCYGGETPVYCMDGNIYPMIELVNANISGIWTLGINPNTGEIIPVWAHSFRVGQYTTKIYNILFSNGYTFRCTENHPIMNHVMGYTKAEDIHAGFIPTRLPMLFKSYNGPTVRPSIKGKYIQDISYEYFYGDLKPGCVKHHKDRNTYNNYPDNFQQLTRREHRLIHESDLGSLYRDGLTTGLNTMFSDDSPMREFTRQKNRRLRELYMRDANMRRFLIHINDLVEQGKEVTEENYESLRESVYNLPKISTLIKNGYADSFEGLCNVKLPTVGEMYEKEPIERQVLQNPFIKEPPRKLRLAMVRKFDSLLLQYGFIDYNLYKDSLTAHHANNISEDEFNIYLNMYENEYPFVVDITITELKEPEPMYDFTVDEYENMLLPMITNKHAAFNNIDPIPMFSIHNSSIYGTMKPMANVFEIKKPLLSTQGAWGNKYGEDAAAMRYTEAMISPFAYDIYINELIKYSNCVDWQPNFDNTILEPECLPAALPILLVNGSFGLGVGLKVEIPKHNLAEVIDETIAIIKDRSHRVTLIPDSCMNCEIIDTNFQEICDTGYGSFTVRGVMEDGVSPKGNPTIIVKSAPDLVYYETIDNAISNMVSTKKLVGILSTNHQGNDFIIEVKKGSDINYIKQMLYQHTDLQKNCRVSFEVLDKTHPTRMSYKAYILFWLEFRKYTKLRQYYAQLQDVNTEMHKLEPYIKLARSPKMNQIIDKIRKSKKDDDWLLEYLIKELDVTDLQAKFIINLRMKNLSGAYLTKYVEAYDAALKEQEIILSKIADDRLVEADIITELEDIKAKYGTKRTCKVISKNTAIGIPQGEFTVIITENNFVKKIPINDTMGSFKNDKPKYIIRGENTESLLIFNEMAKVFKIPIHKIGFSDKRSNGIDIRFLLKNCTSNINAIMYEPVLRKFMDKITKYYIVTLSADGYIKKMDIDDFLSANASGLIYAKLDPGDYIKDIMIIGDQSDVIVYTQAKALRFSMEEVPYLKRSTKGNKAIGGADPVKGLSVVLADTTDVVIVTKKGYINRIPVIAFPKSTRAKSPGKVIKLGKGDQIIGLYGLNINDIINVTTTEGKYDIPVADVPQGSSVSAGTKMIKTRSEEILYCYYQRKQG